MAETEMPVFGYARLAHKSLVQVYSDNIVPATQIAFILGKLLPMEVDLWAGIEIPDPIPEDWIPLEITEPTEGTEEADTQMREQLPNRTRGWMDACRSLVFQYHQRFSPELEEIRVIEEIPPADPEEAEETEPNVVREE